MDEVTVKLTNDEGLLLRMFLAQALDGMSEACSVKEAQDAAIQAVFAVVVKTVSQLPQE